MELYKRGDSPFWWFSAAVNGRRIRGSTSETRKGAARIIAEGKVTQARENAPHTGRWKVNQLLGTYLDGHLKHTKNIATSTYQMKALAQAKRHGAALIGTERSRWGSRGHAGCTPGNHKCVALMLAFFDALDGATVTGITERAVAECEQRMKETSDE